MVLEASEVMQTPGNLRRTGVDSVSEDAFALAGEVGRIKDVERIK